MQPSQVRSRCIWRIWQGKRRETRGLGDYIDPSILSLPTRVFMGDGDRRTSGRRQQYEQPVVDVGTERSYAGEVWSGSRLVGWALERRPGPRRGRWTERASLQRGMEPHPADPRHVG